MRVLILLLLAPPVYAIVGDPMNTDASKPGFSGDVMARFDFSDGNVQHISAGTGATVRYRKDTTERSSRWMTLLRGEYSMGRQSGQQYQNSLFSTIRQIHMPWERIGLMGFIQYEYNQFHKLNARTTIGAGPLLRVIWNKPWFVWGSIAPMWEIEQVEGANQTRVGRLAASLGIQYLTDRFAAQNSIFYQPQLGKVDDFRTLNQTEFMVKLTMTLYAGLLVKLHYDRFPPSGVKAFDASISHQLKVTF